MNRFALISTLCLASIAASPVHADATANDYSKSESWLCRPDRHDACTVDLDSMIVEAGGAMRRESFHAAENPRVDCFYVYPTVSMQPTPNATLAIDPEERGVIRQQFARFASKCRPFAPLYRQMTIEQLRKAISSTGEGGDQAMAYGDVRAAFEYYLEHDNHGRGIVLIGHSQGSGELTQLLKDLFDDKPLQKQLVSALLAGTQITVKKGSDVGGTFTSIPVCRKNAQFGCVIVYNSWRAPSPPGRDALGERTTDPQLENVCVNPANVGGGSGELKAYLASHDRGFGNVAPQQPWVKNAPDIGTPFVQVPGMLTAACARNDAGAYLAVTVHADPSGIRADDFSGDVFTHGQVRPRWGLHVVDVELAMGNLLDLVDAQSESWLAAQTKPKH
jgi:hypothetical protein